MKILVTGGAGFIGGNFVHYMVNKYPEDMIVNLDLLTYAGNLETCKPVEGKPNYKFVRGDIADRQFIFDLFEKEKLKNNPPRIVAGPNMKAAGMDITPEMQAMVDNMFRAVPTGHTVGRNDPCPCGSGKKYKKCCGRNN